MKAIRFAVRDLCDMNSKDYTVPEWDIVAHCDDGKMRYTDDVFNTKDEAEVYLAGLELNPPDDLHQWSVTHVSEVA